MSNKRNLSPSGIAMGVPMYQSAASESSKARKAARDKAKGNETTEAKSSSTKAKLDKAGGILNGTEWSKSESRDDLYDFAKAEGLPVKSRMNKGQILEELAKATAAQG